MKTLIFIFCLILGAQFSALAQTEFQLEPTQSMCITGKGEGQDGAINPFYGQDCFAIVENLGDNAFSIRLQQKEKLIRTIAVEKGETKKVKLLKSHVLYFDTEVKTKAKVNFERITQ